MKEENNIQAEEHFIFFPTGDIDDKISQEQVNSPLRDEEPFFEYACVELESTEKHDEPNSALGL
jgi:hypothetical protein